MSVGWAGSSNTYAPTGYHAQEETTLLLNRPGYIFTFTNIAQNGWATFPNLVNLADLSAADVIIFDQSNDGDDDTAEVEALIRKTRSAGKRLISVVLPAWTAVNNGQVNTPANQTAIEQHLAVCAAYGVTVVNFWDYCKANVPGTYDLSDLYEDTAHPTAAGQAIIAGLLDAYMPTGGAITGTPARIYPASADYEYTPTIKNGSAEESRTGTWTEDGASISSAEVGATITYTFTGRKFGIYDADAVEYPTATISIDGGNPILNITLYPNGYDTGVRALHTVVITVTTTFSVDEFWAI